MMAGFALCFGGRQIFSALNMPVPPLVQNLQENALMSAVTVYFVSNMLTANLMKTGAFEVFVDGEQVWSKLETGTLPSWEQLLSFVDPHGAT
eukprot:m.68868 g.68868  ORF g.68868 m.68868 type:complete len:92 (-) comp13934_c0_seq3:39-314(-)